MTFLTDRRGATSIEYAMIAGFISIIIVLAVSQLGQNVNNLFFEKIANDL